MTPSALCSLPTQNGWFSVLVRVQPTGERCGRARPERVYHTHTRGQRVGTLRGLRAFNSLRVCPHTQIRFIYTRERYVDPHVSFAMAEVPRKKTKTKRRKVAVTISVRASFGGQTLATATDELVAPTRGDGPAQVVRLFRRARSFLVQPATHCAAGCILLRPAAFFASSFWRAVARPRGLAGPSGLGLAAWEKDAMDDAPKHLARCTIRTAVPG